MPTTELLESPVRPHGWATEADCLAALDGEPKRLVELLDGELVEKPMGLRESFLASWLIVCLSGFVIPRRLGLVAAPDGLLRVAPGRLRLPDVAFYPWPKPGEVNVAEESIGSRAPTLAVEILSESNTAREMAGKRADYFAAGVLLVWIIDVDARTVAVYRSPKDSALLTGSDVLDGGAVLPGFALALPDLFGHLDPPAPA